MRIKENLGEEAEEDKAITDVEVFNYIWKHYLEVRTQKVKLLVDLVKDGSDKWNEFCAHLKVVPKKIFYMACGMKAFGNLNREENPDFKEEEIEEEEKANKLSELEKIRAIREKYAANKNTNC